MIAEVNPGEISNSWNFVDQNRNSKSLPKIESADQNVDPSVSDQTKVR